VTSKLSEQRVPLLSHSHAERWIPASGTHAELRGLGQDVLLVLKSTSIDEMLSVAGSTARIVVVHENKTFNRHPSWRTADNLSVAEIHPAENVLSRRPITQMEQ
jgi:hypothetical protein